MPVQITEEAQNDIPAIREVNRLAFGRDQEASLVDALRTNGAVLLSLVAKLDGQVVGHILYSPLTVNGFEGAALGPMAVVPAHHRRGIGSRLIEAGSRKLKEKGCPFVVVLGHADYYPRFGFTRASARNITCEWNVPDDAFMVLALDEGKMTGVTGQARYRPEFSATD